MGKYKKGHIIFALDLEEVPLVYLRKILQKLLQQGVIKSYRGRFGGGFSLNRDLRKNYNLKNILER